MAQVQLVERRSVHYSEVIQAQAGETQVVITLPEAVPQGKVLNLRIEISGSYGDPQEPVVREEAVT
ncbi:MAG: hypothetical protein ACYTKD_28135 [Planctomycetota bacterium]|jgi:hypothetical protein